MGDLRVPDIDDDLMAQLKSEAALAKVTLREFVISLFIDALKRRGGKKIS